ncbi:20040_t:CDS:2 [Dentiscutata erythropus]|uniref:20040_t:CDS:1 n=1 Tax=Dentiscutata erythropus TaxID=1348616 RepID=A0A9N9GW41_9GLOM|nr:20040_t:CDS:2 [Dentiscutata erythropus]
MSEANTLVSTSTSSIANGNESLKVGLASDLAKFVREFKEKKKCPFSSYKTQKDLKEILMKHEIDGNSIDTIRQFSPTTYPLKDDDEELQQCIKEIKRKLRNMGTILADSNEAMRCEYILPILHASLYIIKRVTKKELSIAPQLEVVGEENTGRVDYAIKALEELICITEGKLHQVTMGFAQNLVQCESALQVNKKKHKADDAFREYFDYIYGIVTTDIHFLYEISCTSRDPLNIKFSESALKKDSEADIELQKNVKRVIEVIVGLLKDRADVEKEPAMKRQRVQKYFENEYCDLGSKSYDLQITEVIK